MAKAYPEVIYMEADEHTEELRDATFYSGKQELAEILEENASDEMIVAIYRLDRIVRVQKTLSVVIKELADVSEK